MSEKPPVQGWYHWFCDNCQTDITTADLATMLHISDSHECPEWSVWGNFVDETDPE